MKKVLHSSTLLLLAWCLSLLGMQQARASHIQGGQLTYRYVSGNTYEITVSFYRDCNPGAATLPTTVDVTAVNACGGTPVSATLQPVAGTRTIGQGYCPSIQLLATCNPGSAVYPNFEKQDFRGTMVLPPASNWIISHQSCCRPSTANIPTQDDFRFEATLNNQVMVNGIATRVDNTSPTFSSRDVPVPTVIVGQRTTLNFTSATEPDGDSLVYELDRPLATCGNFNPYSTIPSAAQALTCTPTPLPAAPGTICFLQCGTTNTGTTYTANNPLPVRPGDTTGVCGTVAGTVYYRTAQPGFALDRNSGQFTFTPSYYDPTGTTGNGRNKYVVVGKITEYRRLPGSNRRYRVGTVRRDFLLLVLPAANNNIPTQPVITVPDPLSGAIPTNRPDTTRIRVLTCNYARVLVSFTDPDNLATPSANQNLTVFYTGQGDINTDVLQSGDIGTYSLTRNGSTNPVAVFYFQPSAAFAGQTVRIPLRIEDDACPVKGIQTRIIEINIVKGNQATVGATIGAPGLGGTTIPTICPGGSLQLQGNVQRPDSIRTVATGTTNAQRYGFRWTAVTPTANNSGLPANPNTPIISVNPIQTTRYRVSIIPLDGFGANGGGCGDTTSLVVRVASEPVARIAATDSVVCAGASVTLNGSAVRADGLVDTYTYSWSGPGVTNNTPGNSITVNPTTLGANVYTLRINGNPQYGCDVTRIFTVTVAPPPALNITATDTAICAGARVVLRGLASRTDLLADTYTYTWTGPGITGNSAGDSVVVNPTTPGVNIYTLRAVGNPRLACEAVKTVRVTVVPAPTVRLVTNNAFVCAGGSATLTASATPPTGFRDTYTYRFASANGLPNGSLTSATPTVNPTRTTRYFVTVSGNARTACVDTASVVVNVVPSVQAAFGVDSAGVNNRPTNRPPVVYTFTNRTVVPTNVPNATVVYRWTYQRVADITGASTSGVADSLTTFSRIRNPQPLTLGVAGTYRVRLTTTLVINGTACSPTTSERTLLVPDNSVPNIITPNGDGLNDVFRISTAATASKVEIYNRWGRKIKEFSNYNNDWNGENNPSGLYYYLITDRNGAQTKGWLEINRGSY